MTDTASFDLSGRVALVTGASSGLGERFARILAASGAAVVLAARRADRLDDAVRTIREAGGRAIAVAMDVTDEPSTIAAYDAAEAAFGTVDTIVANAGVAEGAPVIDMSLDDFDRQIAVNLRGVFLTVREGGRRLIAADAATTARGRIVINASVAATHVAPGIAAYSASKAGAIQFGRVVAREWIRTGIAVNMLCPGYVMTDINRDYYGGEAGAAQVARFNRKRMMAPDALDAMLLYLASDAAGPVTGSVFTVDDGQSL